MHTSMQYKLLQAHHFASTRWTGHVFILTEATKLFKLSYYHRLENPYGNKHRQETLTKFLNRRHLRLHLMGIHVRNMS